MRIALLALALAISAFGAETSGQTGTAGWLLSHPEFSPHKIQSMFVLDEWRMKRAVFSKSAGVASCKSELFIYGSEPIAVDDARFCERMSALLKAYTDGGVVTILVYSFDSTLKDRAEALGNDSFAIPQESMVLLGLRNTSDEVLVRVGSDETVNTVVSEILSLSRGQVTHLFGKEVPE